jgi:hypothetical protein
MDCNAIKYRVLKKSDGTEAGKAIWGFKEVWERTEVKRVR